MPTFCIRPAYAGDAALIRALVRVAQLNPINLHWERFLVAEAGGRVIGIGQIRLHRAGTRELASLVVVPEAQGQGVGRALVEALLAREQGPVFLFCAARLVDFYQRFGFTVVSGSAAPGDLWLLRLGARVISAVATLLGRPGVVMMQRT